jgi:hypothetical protein
MLTIHKFTLAPTENGELKIRGFVKSLSVENQRESIVMYALIDLENLCITTVPYGIYGTGHELPDMARHWQFLGTVKLYGGDLMFHVFGG